MTSHWRKGRCPLTGDVARFQEAQDVQDGRWWSVCVSPRAGGLFQLPAWEPDLSLTDRDRANLCYWIYQHNRQNGLLSVTDLAERPQTVHHPGGLSVTSDWTAEWQSRAPSLHDRLLSFLQEVIRQTDSEARATDFAQWQQDRQPYLLAASGCVQAGELAEFWDHCLRCHWLRTTSSVRALTRGSYWDGVTLEARMHLEEQQRVRGQGAQGFVAMWFPSPTDSAYLEMEAVGAVIAEAIEAAGYQPYRVDKDLAHNQKLDDRIIAALRQSRFAVADFTCGPTGQRGSVYYEAGFAHGQDLPVIFTCRRDIAEHEGMAFDTRQHLHLLWDPDHLKGDDIKHGEPSLERRLQARIEALLGPGPGKTLKDQGSV